MESFKGNETWFFLFLFCIKTKKIKQTEIFIYRKNISKILSSCMRFLNSATLHQECSALFVFAMTKKIPNKILKFVGNFSSFGQSSIVYINIWKICITMEEYLKLRFIHFCLDTKTNQKNQVSFPLKLSILSKA